MAVTRTMLSAKTRKTIEAVETGAEIHPRKLPALFEGLRDDVAQVDKAGLSFAELTRLLDTALALGDLLLRPNEDALTNSSDQSTELNEKTVPIITSQVMELLARQELVPTSTIISIAESLYVELNVVPSAYKKKEILSSVLDTLITYGAAESTTPDKRRTIRSKIHIKHEVDERKTENKAFEQLHLLGMRFMDFISLDRLKKYRVADFMFIARGFNRELGHTTLDKSIYKYCCQVMDYLVASGSIQLILEGRYKYYVTEDYVPLSPMPSPDDSTTKKQIERPKTIHYDSQFLEELLEKLRHAPIKRSDVISEFTAFCRRHGYSCSDGAIAVKFPITMGILISQGLVVKRGQFKQTTYQLTDTGFVNRQNTLNSILPGDNSVHDDSGNPSNEEIAVAFSESLLKGLHDTDQHSSPVYDEQTQDRSIDESTELAVRNRSEESAVIRVKNYLDPKSTDPTISEVAPEPDEPFTAPIDYPEFTDEITEDFQETDQSVEAAEEQYSYPQVYCDEDVAGENSIDLDVIDAPVSRLSPRHERTRLDGEKKRLTYRASETYLKVKVEASKDDGTLELESGETFSLDWFEARVLLKIVQSKSSGLPFMAILAAFKAHPLATGTRLFDTIVSLNNTVFAHSTLYIESVGKANPQVKLAHKVISDPAEEIVNPGEEAEELPKLTKAEALPHIIAYVATTEDYDDRIDEVASRWQNKDVDALLLALNDRGVPIDSINATRIELVLSSAPGPVHKYGTQLLKQAVAEYHARNF